MLDTIKAATEKILLIRNTARGRRCRDHPHFVDENTEVQSSTGNGPESHIRWVKMGSRKKTQAVWMHSPHSQTLNFTHVDREIAAEDITWLSMKRCQIGWAKGRGRRGRTKVTALKARMSHWGSHGRDSLQPRQAFSRSELEYLDKLLFWSLDLLLFQRYYGKAI